jgi:hypothetical protein
MFLPCFFVEVSHLKLGHPFIISNVLAMDELRELEDEIQSTVGPPDKRGMQVATIQCVGEKCAGVEFSPEEEGCSAALALCPSCYKEAHDLLRRRCFNLYGCRANLYFPGSK